MVFSKVFEFFVIKVKQTKQSLFNFSSSSRSVLPNFAERIRIAVDTLRMRPSNEDGKVNLYLSSYLLFEIEFEFSLT